MPVPRCIAYTRRCRLDAKRTSSSPSPTSVSKLGTICRGIDTINAGVSLILRRMDWSLNGIFGRWSDRERERRGHEDAKWTINWGWWWYLGGRGGASIYEKRASVDNNEIILGGEIWLRADRTRLSRNYYVMQDELIDGASLNVGVIYMEW